MKWKMFALVLLCTGLVSANARMALIPEPVEVESRPGVFTLTAETVIVEDPEFHGSGLGRQLADYLAPASGHALNVTSDMKGPNGETITIRRNASLERLGGEGYTLSVTPGGVTIEAAATAGAFYGIQTLRQLLPPEVFSDTVQTGVSWTLPCVEITDYPRFRWRGLHMDVSRHFHDAEYVKRFLDIMAAHKLNSFHWHLCDDDGWRIEIKKYPLLTEKGSSNSRTINYGEPTFYTQEQIRDVVRYAAARHINIVPEIEIPGHEAAAIGAYPEWGARNADGKLGNVFNIRDETVDALKDILAEVAGLFPGPYIHCGGDEVWAAWVWTADPASAKKAARLGLTGAHAIQTWLMNEMGAFLATKGRRMVGWGEIAGDELSKETVVMAWRGDGKTGITSAKKGFDVVMAPGAYTYFDHRQGANERGFGGSVLSLEKVYSFDPAVPDKLSAEEARHILGVQAQLWAELIPSSERMDHMAYPRACALAEVAWTPQAERTYSDFAQRLGIHLHRLDALQVNYRLPDIAIQEEDAVLRFTSAVDDARIHYTTDGTEPDANSAVYTGPIPDDRVATLQARIVLPNGRMGPIARRAGICSTSLRANNCRIDGRMSVESLKPGHQNIGGWGDPKGRLTWQMRVPEAGRYAVAGTFSGGDAVEMHLAVGKQGIPFSLPRMKGWGEPVPVTIGEITIDKPGIYPVVLSVARAEGYRGINMWGIEFTRAAVGAEHH